jgi:hypothetical protein
MRKPNAVEGPHACMQHQKPGPIFSISVQIKRSPNAKSASAPQPHLSPLNPPARCITIAINDKPSTPVDA